MIAVDGSALFAILLGEHDAARCKDVLSAEEVLLISAASLAEVLIVAAGRGVLDDMRRLLDGLGLTVIPLTEERAHAAAVAYRRLGQGFRRSRAQHLRLFRLCARRRARLPPAVRR